jgi:hypothetical protein
MKIYPSLEIYYGDDVHMKQAAEELHVVLLAINEIAIEDRQLVKARTGGAKYLFCAEVENTDEVLVLLRTIEQKHSALIRAEQEQRHEKSS